MSLITCTICNKDIGDCECPGQDEGLHAIAYNPESHVAFKWCRACDKHYARCKCEQPQFFVMLAGKDISDQRLVNALGNVVEADLTKR